MSETADILRKARALVARRKGWCKGNYAVNKFGGRVVANSADAKQFCMIGACAYAADEPVNSIEQGPIYSLLEEVLGENPIDFNDDAETKKEVLNAFDRAIAAEEAKS